MKYTTTLLVNYYYYFSAESTCSMLNHILYCIGLKSSFALCYCEEQLFTRATTKCKNILLYTQQIYLIYNYLIYLEQKTEQKKQK